MVLECILGVTWADILLGGKLPNSSTALEWFIQSVCSKGFVCPMLVWEISREVDYDMSVLYHQKLWSDMIENGKPRQFFEVNVGECRWTFGCLLQMYGTADGDVFWWCFVGRVLQNLLARKSMTWGRSWKPPKMPGLAMPCWVGLFCWNKAKICQDIDSCHQELGNSNIFKPCFFLFFWWTTYAVPRVLWLMKSIIIQMLCIQCI